MQQNMASIANSSYAMYVNTESLDLDEESGNNFLHSAHSRAMLMQKLTRENPAGMFLPANPTSNLLLTPNQNIVQVDPQKKLNKEEISPQPTTCVLLSNMFTKDDSDVDSKFLANLKDEVKGFYYFSYIEFIFFFFF